MLHLLSPRGFRAGAAAAGIKSGNKLDVGLLVCDVEATAAAVFTTNKVRAAGVTLGERHVASGKLRGVVVNSGNANACTGRRGEKDAWRMCRLAAEVAHCPPKLILPSSTGIIGHYLPMEKIERGIAAAGRDLGRGEQDAQHFAGAILTTDLARKSAAVRARIGGKDFTLAGVCKGSGMIGPRLGLHATMLAYLTTDARISPGLLRKLLFAAAEGSFNAVTVDDHASTNDTLAILASGLGPAIDSPPTIKVFSSALSEVCQSLARQIAADGEGATKIVRIDVKGARTAQDAKAIARSIANSPLVKCAMNGNDPNWGRIVSAAGMCGADFDPDKSVLRLQGKIVFRAGQPAKFNAKDVSRALAQSEVVVDLACGLGKSAATVWTCDLSREYVTINADYHT
ncbi:MAG: bifunctional glutamate N-acetyltransferase/amino-acid acetyltransferase ArgJ [Tepidisphaeraceae bacterium]|jgi:glutamate N-acetyltransferase/amino-acid N-acetyltransferase